MKMPELPEVELPPLPPMGYGSEGYSALALQEYAVEYAEKFARIYGEAVREECARVADRMDHDGVMVAARIAAAIRANT